MRFLILPFMGLLLSIGSLYAQTPGVINYQAAIREANGKPVSNEIYECLFQFNVGDQVYEETQIGVTDDFGVLNFQIGGDGVKALDWSKGNATMYVELNGTISYNDTVYIAAVPFALYAETSGSSLPGPPPAHEWDGTRIRFENPDGTFGPFTDVQGPQGNSVNVVGSVPSIEDLPSGNNNEIGDLIFIESTGEGFVWNGEKWINLGKIQGPKGDQGEQGSRGEKGDKPRHQWLGTSLSFENPNGSFGAPVDLKGEPGIQGESGLAPQHQWMSSQLRFRNPDGSWGAWIDLKGDTGATGLSPEHEWNNTLLRFRNPDGSWGIYSDLQGNPGIQGEKGDKPQHQWNGTSVRFENPDGSFGPFIDLQGPQGNSVTVVGSVPTSNDLPDGTNNNVGDMIISADTGEGYVWTGDSWVNVGQVQGPPGDIGPMGPAPDHQWNDTALRFRNADGTWGVFTDLKGDQGEQGLDGLAPEHQWYQTGLRFRNPDGTWGSFTNLQGPEGEMGLAPEHQWNQTALRFRNPNGTWGEFINLQGEQGIQGPQGPQGDQGDQGVAGQAPEHQWNQTALRFRNPDGSWGSFTNLKGDQGEPGPPGASSADGDVTGPLGSTTVAKIRGINVAATTPTEGQLMVFLNGAWRPASAPSPGGDVSGTISNSTVVGLQNTPLSVEVPENGEILQYLDGAWRPTSLPQNDNSGKVYAGAVNQFGNQSYVSDPNISVTVEGSVVTVSVAGVDLNGNNCSAVAIGRNNLNLFFRVTFLNGSARFTVNENGADPYPMNFLIYR